MSSSQFLFLDYAIERFVVILDRFVAIYYGNKVNNGCLSSVFRCGEKFALRKVGRIFVFEMKSYQPSSPADDDAALLGELGSIVAYLWCKAHTYSVYVNNLLD